MAIIKNRPPGIVPIYPDDDVRQKRSDRRAIAAGDLSDRHFAALREAMVPVRFAELDAELIYWKP